MYRIQTVCRAVVQHVVDLAWTSSSLIGFEMADSRHSPGRYITYQVCSRFAESANLPLLYVPLNEFGSD